MSAIKMAFVFALVASVAGVSLPASAGTLPGHIVNQTNACVWFTIDTASAWTKFHNQRYGFIKPNQSDTWDFNSAAEIKFRAEPRKTADCASPRIADMEIVSERGQHKAALTGQPGAFRLYFTK
jgi:hypothetical protein